MNIKQVINSEGKISKWLKMRGNTHTKSRMSYVNTYFRWKNLKAT